MIKFSCKLCGEKISVQDRLSGKRIKCPKCNNACVVPAESPRIKFDCPNCGRGIRVLQIHGGKKGQCPKCKSPVVVPSLKAESSDGSGTVTVVCLMCNERIRSPKDSQERFVACPACGSNVETALGAEPPAPDISISRDGDQDEYEEEYEDQYDADEEDESPDRRLIFAVCGAAVVVVVGLIILITVILPSESEPIAEPEMSLRQEGAGEDSGPVQAPSNDRPAGTFTLGPAEEDVAAEEPTVSPAAASDAVSNNTLKLRLKPGQVHALRLISENKIVQTPMGQRQEINSVKTTELEFKVEDVDPNGVMRLKVTYLAIKEKGQGAGPPMEYDSTTFDLSTEHPFGPMYSAMIGQSFMARVTPEGRMVGLEGVDRMYLAMADKIVQGEDDATRKRISERMTEGAEGRIRRSIERANEAHGSRLKRVEMVQDMLKKNPIIAAERIAEMVGNLIMVYPGGAVETGDSWQAKKALFSLGTVDVDCTYTVKEKKPTVIVVGISSKIDLDNELVSDKGSAIGSTRTTMTGSYEGTIQIDPSSGWMLRKNATMRCSGEVIMPPNEQMPQGMTMPVSMETVVTVEPIE